VPAVKQLAALTTFVVGLKDGDVIIRKGEVLPSNHPNVKGPEELFAPFDPAKNWDPPPWVRG
jgi:hypothetical protein